MAEKANNDAGFLSELKRWKVIRVTTVYSAAAFIILQLTDIVARPLHLPEWTLTLIIVLLAIGVLIVILLSWVYDITPEGMKKTGSKKVPKNKEPEVQLFIRSAITRNFIIKDLLIIVVILH